MALGWGAVDPAIVRAVPTGGLMLIVAMVALPLILLAMSGAVRIAGAGAADADDASLDHELITDSTHDIARNAAVGVVRHESHGGDRHERPHHTHAPHHAPRPHRTRSPHRAAETSDGRVES